MVIFLMRIEPAFPYFSTWLSFDNISRQEARGMISCRRPIAEFVDD
jgi:hypothetical protein